MIVEVLIASVASVTIVGTWLGLRFARDELHPKDDPDERREKAIDLFQKAIRGEVRREELLALLATDPESLPADVRGRAICWVRGEPMDVNATPKASTAPSKKPARKP